MSEATIRSAVPADAPALARLRWEFRTGLAAAAEPEERFVARCAAWMEARLGERSAWRCWVAEDERGIAGQLWLERIEKIPNPVGEKEMHAYVTNVHVRDDQRGRGVGSQLLAAALREADAGGVDAVLLWPTERSRSLYRRHGFRDRGELMVRAAGGGH